MNRRTVWMSCVACLAILAGTPLSHAQTPMETKFTYQGQLKSGGTPLNADADFAFALFDALEGGSQIGSTLAANAVDVAGGLFTVELDFGVMAFNGDARWLEIAVRSPAGSGEFTTLAPRQPLTAAPYALQSRGLFCDEAGNIGIGTTNPKEMLHNAGGYYGQGNIWLHAFHGDGASGTAYLQARDDSGDSNISLRFRTQSNGAFRDAINITPLGDVGIGTTSPKRMLHNAGAYYGKGHIFLHASEGDGESGTAYLMARDDSGDSDISLCLRTQSSGDRCDAINIKPSGNVGIGTTNPKEMLHNAGAYYGRGNIWLHAYHGDGVDGTAYLQARDDSGTSNVSLQLRSQRLGVVQDAINISSSGYVRIQNGLYVEGSLCVEDVSYGDYGNAQYEPVANEFYYDNSSRKYKENITPLADDFDKLLVAQPRTYTRPGKPDRWEIGYIAEEFADLGLERLVYYDEDGAPFGVNYSKLPLYITQIVKGHRARLEAKDAEIAGLQTRLNAKDAEFAEMQARMNKLEALVAELASASLRSKQGNGGAK